MTDRPHVVVIGAGAGGLSAAIDLARRNCRVTVLERADRPGGKIRAVPVGDAFVDGGPTVFTMRWIFDELFGAAGHRLEDRLTLTPADVLARHAWTSGGRLDLFRDIDRSVDAIEAFAGPREAEGYRRFCRDAGDIFETLKDSFISGQRPSQMDLVQRVGLRGMPGLFRTRPWETLWHRLGHYFRDPRLRQLFGRYATYVGSSPLLAPTTLMLIAHVEQEGVWLVDGGMARLAEAMRDVGEDLGAEYRFNSHVSRIETEGRRATGVVLADGEHIPADAIVYNGDISALPKGLLGPSVIRAASAVTRENRSLSAATWCLSAPTDGFPLAHHTVFFAESYPPEFDAIFRKRTIVERPTVYICAQDRDDAGTTHPNGPERLLVLINAPPDGDNDGGIGLTDEDLAERAFGILAECGLSIDRANGLETLTSPVEFNALFPGSGGSLYGRANHGASASFDRMGATSRIRGLYLAGGSVHPGAGVPMATMSGRLAADRVAKDLGLGP